MIRSRITNVKNPRQRRAGVIGVTSLSGGMLRPAIKKMMIAHMNKPGQTKSARRMSVHMANLLIVCPTRLPNMARAMWPPSSCPIGSRFRAVTNSPSHPAKASG